MQTTTSTFFIAWKKVGELIATFEANEHHYASATYQEAEVRKDFLDKFFCALGWDVDHDVQANPYEQEVKVEPSIAASGQRRADYAFYLTPNFRRVRFFVEAKKPFVELATPDNLFQIIRYAWSSETPLAILTNFRELHLVDCRYKPDIGSAIHRTLTTFHYKDFLDQQKFSELYWLFSREALLDGSIEKRTSELPKPRKTAKQRGLFPQSYLSIDEAFLEELDEYRLLLARSFKSKNSKLDGETLTELVQRTLDRLVFMRFLEDKGIEPHKMVEHFGDRSNAWEDFKFTSKRLDGVYNGIVFKRHAILDSSTFTVDESVFSGICDRLTRSDSPYDFDAIPIHILGAIYERFLGNVITTTAKRARVEPKPEFRKAEGVYYTPDYIVAYIVRNTIGQLIARKTPDQIAKMHFADIASGSGSFLLGIFEALLEYHGHFYNANPKQVRPGDCITVDGKLYLSLKKKRDILESNIFGIDIDQQAIEVCQLSLYLRLLKEETPGTTHQHLLEFAHDARMKKLLPDLKKNIVCGNSLIGNDIHEHNLFDASADRILNPIEFEDVFPQLRKGRFDAVIGNPPYRMLQPSNTPAEVLAYLRQHFTAANFKIEMFHLFLQRALSLIASGGYVGYIVPTTILNNVYAEPLRKAFLAKTCIEQIAVAKQQVFKDADVHTSILIFRGEERANVRMLNEVQTTQNLSERFVAKPKFESQTLQGTFDTLPGHAWNILVKDSNSLLVHRLISECDALGNVAAINRGLITGDRDRFFATERIDTRYVPILTGSDVHRYQVHNPREYVLFERPPGAGGCWDREVHLCNHKLLIRQIAAAPTAGFIDHPFAATGNIFTIKSHSIDQELFLLGIINSELIRFFWRIMFTDFKESFPQVTIFSLAQLPIVRIDDISLRMTKGRERIVSKVRMMILAKTSLHHALSDKDKGFFTNRILSLERSINESVNELYQLSADEKELVEVECREKMP